MITDSERAAIKVMAEKAEGLAATMSDDSFEKFQAIKILHHAIRHLAYPDRDVYPKVRGSRKGGPIVSRHRP